MDIRKTPTVSIFWTVLEVCEESVDTHPGAFSDCGSELSSLLTLVLSGTVED